MGQWKTAMSIAREGPCRDLPKYIERQLSGPLDVFFSSASISILHLQASVRIHIRTASHHIASEHLQAPPQYKSRNTSKNRLSSTLPLQHQPASCSSPRSSPLSSPPSWPPLLLRTTPAPPASTSATTPNLPPRSWSATTVPGLLSTPAPTSGPVSRTLRAAAPARRPKLLRHYYGSFIQEACKTHIGQRDCHIHKVPWTMHCK